MKSPEPGDLLFGSFKITKSISLLAIGLLKLSGYRYGGGRGKWSCEEGVTFLRIYCSHLQKRTLNGPSSCLSDLRHVTDPSYDGESDTGFGYPLSKVMVTFPRK